MSWGAGGMRFEDGLACSIRCMPHVQALKKLLGTTTLKDFRAAHNALGDAGAQAVAECLDSARCAIERLSLVANGIGTKGFQALASTQRHAAVQLHISGNLRNLDWQSRVEAARDLSRCFTLMDVVVSSHNDKSTPDDKAQEVRQALRHDQAEIFWVKREGCKELAAALQGQSQLQVLHIGIGRSDVEAVLEAVQGHVMLKSLVLFDCSSDTKAFGFLDGKSGLEELVLHSVNINMKALAPALKGLAALKVLFLWDKILGDVAAKALAESLTGMSLLEQLNLYDNQIGSKGAQAKRVQEAAADTCCKDPTEEGLWRSPSRACPCSSSCTYILTRSDQRVLRLWRPL